MFLESVIIQSIDYCRNHGICYLHKHQPHHVFVAKNNMVATTKNRMVDFLGCWKGIYIAFEAKETAAAKFYLRNLKEHQIEYLNLIHTQGGIAFIMVYFSQFNRYFVMRIDKVMLWKTFHNGMSVPINYFIEKGYEVFPSYPNIFDFSKIFNHLTN